MMAGHDFRGTKIGSAKREEVYNKLLHRAIGFFKIKDYGINKKLKNSHKFIFFYLMQR